ncbi:MAG: hypothetical protein L6427_02855 [Actinomycetia bacterium]|nr:hypothetical protein [Actinomycetes bacterium]
MERFTRESFREGKWGPEEEAGRRQRYLVVVNPVSRGGKALKEGIWLLKHLGRLGIRHEAFFTESPGHAEKIVARWVEKADVVAAVGGDGTINEVVNGMMAFPKCEKTLAVFPAGTADDYCHNVGIPRDRGKALDILLTDNDRRIDLIRFNDRYAVVQVGIGVDAEIAYNMLQHKNVRVPAYFATGLRIVFKERFRNSIRDLRIESDSRAYDGKFLVAVFGNAPLYGRYVYWMPDAKMDDGILNMSALRPMSPAPAWILLMRCFKKGYHSEKIIYDASERFAIDLVEESFLQVDGEVYKYNSGKRLDVSVVPGALKVRVPGEPEEEPPFVDPCWS